MRKKEGTEDLELIHIKSLIENGTIKRMRDLKDSSSTKIARLAGINQGRYSSKLFNPGDFSVSEIVRISLVLGIEARYLSEIISKEITKEEVLRIESYTIKLKQGK